MLAHLFPHPQNNRTRLTMLRFPFSIWSSPRVRILGVSNRSKLVTISRFFLLARLIPLILACLMIHQGTLPRVKKTKPSPLFIFSTAPLVTLSMARTKSTVKLPFRRSRLNMSVPRSLLWLTEDAFEIN
jgi:hypothetical protein